MECGMLVSNTDDGRADQNTAVAATQCCQWREKYNVAIFLYNIFCNSLPRTSMHYCKMTPKNRNFRKKIRAFLGFALEIHDFLGILVISRKIRKN